MDMEIMLVSQADNLIDKVLKFNETVVKCALKQPFDIMGCIKENAREFSPTFAAMREFGVADTDLNLEDILIDGIVVDEEKARTTPCKCVKLDGKDLCWSHGIIGMLSQSQVKLYCPQKIYENRPEFVKHLKEFKEIAEETKGMPLLERIELMHELLKRKKKSTGRESTAGSQDYFFGEGEDFEEDEEEDVPEIYPEFKNTPLGNKHIELDETLPFEEHRYQTRAGRYAMEL